MKKEYKTPVLSIVNVDVESLLQTDSKQGEWAEGKKNNGEFVDEGEIAAPETPKKFWDDEE